MENRARLFFGSETFPRILGFLADEPGRELTASEIAEHVSGSRDSLYRALDRALRLGLVKRRRRGGISTYQINTESPVYPEVKNLLSKLLGIAGALRSALAQFGPPAVEQAFIYGSAARAEDLYTSDIDLFVVGEATNYDVAQALRDVQGDFRREINAVVHTREQVEERLAAGDPFLLRVWSQPKIFLVGDELPLPLNEEMQPSRQFLHEMAVGHYSRPYVTYVVGGVPEVASELDDRTLDTIEHWFSSMRPEAQPKKATAQVGWWEVSSPDAWEGPEWQGWLHPGPVVAIRRPAHLHAVANDARLDLRDLVSWWRSLGTDLPSVLRQLGIRTCMLGLTVNTLTSGSSMVRIVDLEFDDIPKPHAGAAPDQVPPWTFRSGILRPEDANGDFMVDAVRSLLRHFSYRHLDPTLSGLELQVRASAST